MWVVLGVPLAQPRVCIASCWQQLLPAFQVSSGLLNAIYVQHSGDFTIMFFYKYAPNITSQRVMSVIFASSVNAS